MANYRIPIKYSRVEYIEVEAENLQTAVENSLKEFLSIPDEDYLDDSFDIDDIYIQENYPNEKIDYKKLLQ
jgi:predicted membrane protein